MIWTGTGKDTGIGTEIEVMILKTKVGSARRVEVERGMTMRGTEAEKEEIGIEIGGDE